MRQREVRRKRVRTKEGELMALDLTVRYPGQIDGTDGAYPYGKAKNVSAPSAGDGTPFERDIVNDTQGFLQALLVSASITPSGVPDTSAVSQYLEALDAHIYGPGNRTVNIPFTGAPKDGVTSVKLTTNANMQVVSFDADTVSWLQPLSLPDGVTLTSVGGRIHQGSGGPAVAMTMSVWRCFLDPAGTGSGHVANQLGSSATFGSVSSSYYTQSVAIAADNVISNEFYSYYVLVTSSDRADVSPDELYWLRATVTDPLAGIGR
jgi:hypothetical protein